MASQIALAQTPPAPAASPCDPQYFASLKSRAWMEAQREITQNENLIVKPDSVLEYTCFDQYLKVLAYEAQNMFSESTRWGNILGSNSMDTALQSLVGTALSTYIAANFSSSFRANLSKYNYTPGPITGIPGANFVCNNMYSVWMEAKCVDFIGDVNTDGFYTFEQYRDTADKRTRPSACNNPQTKTNWIMNINFATINNSTPWAEDVVTSYADLFDHDKCKTAKPLKTGIVVMRSKGEPQVYFEKACLAPGCHYVPSGTGNTQTPGNNGSCAEK